VPDAVAVLETPGAALAALDPMRASLLAALAAEPASAAAVAARLGLPRQKVGYHLNALAEHGLVVEVEQRRHGGLTERILAASAGSYVVSPAAMGGAGADAARVGGTDRDRLSASYLLALAGRVIREVGQLARVRRRLPTLAIDADLRFATAAERDAFADDLADAVRTLAARYHDESAAGGRWYRVVALAHPRPQEDTTP
jgi:DNA-binding transcriptional ArsR family regulator